MNGILYGEMLLILFFVVFVLYSLVYLVSRVLIEKNKTVKNEETIKNEKLTIKDIVSMSVMLSVTFGIIIGGICWIINAKVVVVAFLVVVLSYLYSTIIFLVAIYDFIKYVFVKKFDYELTQTHESSLWFIGLSALVVCYTIEIDKLGVWIEQTVLKLTNYQSDIVKIVVLIFWYFSILFFTAIFFMLFINKTLRIYRNIIKGFRNKPRNKCKKTSERNERERLSEKIWTLVEKKQQAKGWRKVILYFGWLICLVLEALKEFILALMRVIKELLRLLFIGFPKWLLVQVKKLLNLLEQDLGKAIIISSRISLVGALLIVYLVDKYQKVLSAEGSDVYEFLCSVIMIPFLITQLSALRRTENSEKK